MEWRVLILTLYVGFCKAASDPYWIDNVYEEQYDDPYPSSELEDLEDLDYLEQLDLADGRLPTQLEPYHYNLELKPYIYEENPPFTYEGSVVIYFTCREPTDLIVINSQSLNIFNDSIRLIALDDPAGAPDILTWRLVPVRSFLIFQLDRNLTLNEEYLLFIEFDGGISSVGVGLYWNSYEKAGGETQIVMGSQLQPHFARRVFPCFDEPAMKARFHVIIVRKLSVRSLSNGALIRSDVRDDDWMADNFATTPYMSPYLLAFVVMDFSYLDTTTSTGQRCRVWARDDVLDAAQWASSVVAPITDWLTNFTGLTDPNHVINHVAIPGHNGGMENWGLIIYGESNLLYDENWYNSANLRSTGTIIGHELSHFWWGNLVTCNWWSHTWLNEGFASYFEAFSLESIGWPASDIILGRVVGALQTDAYNTSVPVSPEVISPPQAALGFSRSAYYKGASILRMLEDVLGASTFQKGIQRYLSNHSYSSAVGDDLWAAFTEQAALDNITDGDAPLDIKKKFDPWILQAGYPLLTVERDYIAQTVTVTQSHFNPDDQEWPPSEFGYMWNVPINMVSQDDPTHPGHVDVWIDMEPSVTITAGVPEDENAWILINAGAPFFYRVLYDDQNHDSLVKQLVSDHLKFSLDSRAALINDGFSLARVGLVSEVSAFETTEYLDDEHEGLPWVRADDFFTLPDRLLSRFPETFALFETYMRGLVDPIYEYKGWLPGQGEPIYQMFLREVAIRLACEYDNTDCVSAARLLFDDWKNNPQLPNPILADQRPTVYCTSVREGTEEDWQAVYDRYHTPSGPGHLPNISVEITALRDALSCSLDTNVLERYLDMIFDPDQIEPGHASAAMLSLARSDAGRGVVWNHLMQNWRNNSVPIGVSRGYVLNAVVEGFASEEDEIMFDEFWSMYPPADDAEERMYESSSAIVNDNREWALANQQELHDWFLTRVEKKYKSMAK